MRTLVRGVEDKYGLEEKTIDTIGRLPEYFWQPDFNQEGYMREVKRGDIYYAFMGSAVGSEQKGWRPVLILQNDVGNHYSPTTIVAVLTSKKKKMYLPCHVPIAIDGKDYGMAALEQMRTIDKSRLNKYVGRLDSEGMALIDHALQISLGLTPIDRSRKGANYEYTNKK
jgi:mRNA interferase MazF